MKKKYIPACLLIYSFISAQLLPAERFADNIISVYVTRQSCDHKTPWQKLSIEKEKISGTVINGNLILTLSYKLTDEVLLEVSKSGSNKKFKARAVLKDYLCGLALLEVPDKSFFDNLNPVKFNEGAIISGNASAVKWDRAGILKEFPAVYLKSSVEFFESSGAVLMHHMISEIDSGGKGEPVFINGLLAGICSWHYEKEKTIKIIDIRIIKRMLNDYNTGSYEGLPYFSVGNSALENDENLRDYLGLKENETGALVTELPPGSSGSDVLKISDVILSINNTDIDDNGLYMSPDYGRLNFYGLIYLNSYVGDTVKMEIVRDKKNMNVSFRLKPFTDATYGIPVLNFDSPPKYCIFGGLVFQELTRDYLKTWGKDWALKADKRLMYFYDNFKKNPGPRKRYVILSQVLPASVNKGYFDLNNLILDKINNIEIRDLGHLSDVINDSEEKYMVFDFIGGQRIVLKTEQARASVDDVMKKYNINKTYYLGED